MAYPAQRLNFPAPLANVGYFVWPVIDEEGVVAQNFLARYSRHFLEHRVDEDYMLAIVNNEHTLVQCFENAGHLFEPVGLFKFQGQPPHARARRERSSYPICRKATKLGGSPASFHCATSNCWTGT